MSYTTSTLVLKIILVVWIITITRSVLVMIGGGSIFRKANKGEKTVGYIKRCFIIYRLYGHASY